MSASSHAQKRGCSKGEERVADKAEIEALVEEHWRLSEQRERAPETPERWRSIPGYEGLYEVSDWGRVKSLRRKVASSRGRVRTVEERVLETSVGSYGHQSVSLGKDGKSKTWGVHRLVLLAFVGPCPDGMTVCHWPNCNPVDNFLDNLRYGTCKLNGQHMAAHNIALERRNRRLTREEVLRVRSEGRHAGHYAEHYAECLNVPVTAIRKIQTGKTYRNVM